ncbi:MAG: flagellar biosynthetic protein FliP [Planctomycetota bacterium]
MRALSLPTRSLLPFVLGLALWQAQAGAEESKPAGNTPNLELNLGAKGDAQTVSVSMKIVVLMTLLSVAPALLVMMTAFTRIVIVLSFLRHALATQQVPPNMVLIGLSLFMTMFVMAPIWERVHQDAYKPYMEGKIGNEEAMEKALVPMRDFMGRQTRQSDLALFLELSHAPEPQSFDEIKTTTLIPAFILSELRTAFHMGFLIFLPFVIIDLVVASVLMALGMVMLPPAMIALPIKLLLFVMADGWHLVIRSLVVSFQAGG